MRENKRWSKDENNLIESIVKLKLDENEDFIDSISKVLNRGSGGVKIQIDRVRVKAGIIGRLYSGSI